MDFVKSPFGKPGKNATLNSLKKIVCYDSLLQVPFCEEKSVQLFRVTFFQSDFLQNPYFSSSI